MLVDAVVAVMPCSICPVAHLTALLFAIVVGVELGDSMSQLILLLLLLFLCHVASILSVLLFAIVGVQLGDGSSQFTDPSSAGVNNMQLMLPPSEQR